MRVTERQLHKLQRKLTTRPVRGPFLPSEPKLKRYHCESCQASCTFEAMMQCDNRTDCPTIKALNAGVIVDRRPTDFDPTFPSEFTYAEK